MIQEFGFHDFGPGEGWVVVRSEDANRDHVIGITSEQGSMIL